MISEFIISAGFVYGYNYLKSTKRKIKNTFNKIKLDNNLDYRIIKINESEFGYSVIVDLKNTGFKKLEKLQDNFQTGFGAITEIKQNDNFRTATVYILKNVLTDDYTFTPVKVKPYELFLGKTYFMKDIIVSMRELPHMLYSGINSSGKTYCVITALTNLIYWNDARKIEVFLAQISAKKDLRKFKDCMQCRGYADNLEKAYDMFKYLYHTMAKRINMFNSIKDKFVDTIYEWNEFFPKRKMRIIYLVMDEFTSYMPDNLDNKEDAKLKSKCLDILIKLIQQCRCTGIYILASLQRPDKESLPPRLKAQFNCKVSFKQPNIASSLVVTDSDKAYNIKPKREAIVNADDEYLIKTLYLDNKMITKFIENSIDRSHRNYYNYKKELNPVSAPNQEIKPIPPKPTFKKSKNKVKIKCS